jgi:dTDP-4-dehydrorhamnose reductase
MNQTFDISRVLTTGAHGMIGSYVDFGLRTDRDTLDVLNEDAVMRYVSDYRPSAIIHLAGATDTARCEQDPLYAYELNVRGTYAVARAARAAEAVMVYVSTTRVFRGDKEGAYTEDDTPAPDTNYGRSKHMGELVTAALAPHHIIARTAWVFGGGPMRDNKFHGTILRKLMASENVSALNDVYGSPTYGKDFVAALRAMLERGERGVRHITNSGKATRYDIAQVLANSMGKGMHVHSVDRSFFNSGASLPTNETAISTKCILRPWEEALKEYWETEWNIAAP